METRANYVLIGAFTLATIVGMFAFVYWFNSAGTGGVRTAYRIVFESSVSGLRTGAAVLFNGIRVGEVNDLQLDPKNPKQVVVTASIDSNAAIRSDTLVALDFQGLTGIAAIALRGGDTGAPLLKSENGEPPTLRARASATSDLSEAARETMRKVNEFIDTNQATLHNTFSNLETFTKALSGSTDKIDNILAGADRVMAGADRLMGGADGKGQIPDMVNSVKELADNLDHRTDQISVGLVKFSNGGLRNLESLISDARKMVGDLDRAVINFDHNPSRVIFGGGTPAAGQQPEPNASTRRR